MPNIQCWTLSNSVDLCQALCIVTELYLHRHLKKDHTYSEVSLTVVDNVHYQGRFNLWFTRLSQQRSLARPDLGGLRTVLPSLQFLWCLRRPYIQYIQYIIDYQKLLFKCWRSEGYFSKVVFYHFIKRRMNRTVFIG